MEKVKVLISRNFGYGLNVQISKVGNYYIKKNTSGWGTQFETHPKILKVYEVINYHQIKTSLLCTLNISLNIFPYKELEIELDKNLISLIKTNEKLGLKLLKIKLKELHEENKLKELSRTQ
jgi:hypothetical protein